MASVLRSLTPSSGFQAISQHRIKTLKGLCVRKQSSSRRRFEVSAGALTDPWSDMANFEASLNAEMRQMEREMQREMDATRRTIEQARRDIELDARQATESVNGDTVVRRDSGTFYSRSYEMRSGNGYRMESYTEIRTPGMMAPAQAQSSGLSPLILGLALILAAGYSALAAAFNKGYEATKFSDKPAYRWRFVLLWPFFFLFSNKFREQFGAAMQARNKPPTDADGPRAA